MLLVECPLCCSNQLVVNVQDKRCYWDTLSASCFLVTIPSSLCSALMHHSNHVDSSRCYQCVKFLVTLAQK